MKVFSRIIFPIAFGTLVGCQSAGTPEPIISGKDHCESCRMTIVDTRYGGEIVSAKGKIFKFDSIDCLIKYSKMNPEENSAVYVADFLTSGMLLKVEDAEFVSNQNHAAPMDSRYISFNPRVSGADEKMGGGRLRWSELPPP